MLHIQCHFLSPQVALALMKDSILLNVATLSRLSNWLSSLSGVARLLTSLPTFHFYLSWAQVMSVKVPMGDESFEGFSTKFDIFEQVSKNLSDHFCLSFAAPCHS